MKIIILFVFVLGIFACNNQDKVTTSSFIGTWHLVSISDGSVDKGVLMYNADGQMVAALSKKDSMLYGYSGKYEINFKEAYVKHVRDFYKSLPYTKDSNEIIFNRDYSFSEDKQTLTLKPRETKGLVLVWKKVSK